MTKPSPTKKKIEKEARKSLRLDGYVRTSRGRMNRGKFRYTWTPPDDWQKSFRYVDEAIAFLMPILVADAKQADAVAGVPNE